MTRQKDGYLYNCSLLPLFELGALHHDYYLLNLRFPVIYDNNRGLGPVADLWLVAINQNGGFTKVWLSLKTVFFPMVIGVMIWFWRRVQLLARQPTLLESMLMALGVALTILNCKLNHRPDKKFNKFPGIVTLVPLEYLTLSFEMPFMLLLGDMKQGIFYSMLLSFWLVFAGEHLMVMSSFLPVTCINKSALTNFGLRFLTHKTKTALESGMGVMLHLM